MCPMTNPPDLRAVKLDETHHVLVGRVPAELEPDPPAFERLWLLHPPDYHEIKMHGRLVKTPRWQQAYGADYRYTGRVNRALPVTAEMEPYLRWCREIDPRLDGLLFNWYDATEEHYIGAHRDSTSGMIEGAPIVTISLGATRTFRFRRWKGEDKVDLVASSGSVIVIPYATNLAWTHEVPHFKRDRGRRISITLRAFDS